MNKYLIYIFTILSLSIVGCEPMEDVYEELDKEAGDGLPQVQLDLDLTDEDSFDSEDEAKENIPSVLSELYPQLGNGSAVNVTYNLNRGGSEKVDPYTGAANYVFSEDDYYTVDADAGDAGFFNSNFTVTDYIPGILNANVQDPVDGQLQAVTYEFADVEYADITGEVIYEEYFDTDISAFSFQSVTGAQTWTWSDAGGQKYAKMSGYSGGAVPNEDWLISPAIDLAGFTNLSLKFNQAINYTGAGVPGVDLKVKITTNYTGDVTTTTWSDLNVDVWPAGNSWTFVDSKADLGAYEGETVHIAFYYTSTADFASTWEVNSVVVESGETIPTGKVNLFYEYSASASDWYPVSKNEAYYLSYNDYDAMGAPGKYDNFSSSTPAGNYLPQLLEMKYPFAQEEDEIVVVYKYFSSSSGLGTRGDLYTFTNGTWMVFERQIQATLQFGKEGGIWVPDNTIRYTLVAPDYAKIAANPELGTEGSRGNLGTYGNFSAFVWSPEEIQAAVAFVLKTNFPNSEVGQKYLVTYSTYPTGDLQLHLILNADGEYELVAK